MGHKLTTCTFCGVGCGIYLETAENQITGGYPSMTHPANRGRICVRGWHVHEVAGSPDRLTTPLIRRNGDFEEATWDEAYDFIADRIDSVRRRWGPRAIGFLTSPRCSNEENYLLQKLARAVIGTNNVDHGTSVHRSKTIRVLSEMLGIPAATSSIEELEKSDVILVDGIDLARQLPTIAGAVIRAHLAGAKVIVTGTRRYRLVDNCDFFLQIKPRSTVCLYGAMAKIIVDRGLMDLPFIKSRCSDYETFLHRVQSYDVLWAAEKTGVPAELIEEAALTFARARSAMILYASGVEARGEAPIQSIIDLALLTGNLGKEGAGVMPLTEHNNLQGGCDMGMLPDYLPGYRPVADAGERRRLEALWGARIPDWKGMDASAMLRDGSAGSLKALWLDRHDPVVTASLCDAGHALKEMDLVVQQHLFLTRTARYAHVILPVVAFGEERVTFTSTERRIQLAEKVIEPPPGPRAAWEEIVSFANRLGAGWNYSSSADVMDEIGKAIPAYEGASYENLSRDYGRQWPCTGDRPLGTKRLYEDGPGDRKFKFVLIEKPAVPPGAPAEYPFAVVFGYSLYYWHNNVLIAHSETLKREYGILLLDYPEGFVEISREDASDLGLRDGSKIRLTSEHGFADTVARVTDEVKRGMVFVPYFLHDITNHIIGDEDVSGDAVAGQVYVKVEKI